MSDITIYIPEPPGPDPKAPVDGAEVKRLIGTQLDRWRQQDLGAIHAVKGAGLYDVVRWNGAIMEDVFCVTRNPKNLSVGDTVIVRYYNNDPQRPYIKGVAATHSAYDADEPDDSQDPDPSIWYQTGGNWSITYWENTQRFSPGISNTPALLHNGGYSDAHQSAFSPRGISVLPSASGLIVVSLQPTYTSPGGETVSIEESETTYISSDPSYYAGALHTIETLIYAYFSELNEEVPTYFIGDRVYPLYEATAAITITYKYAGATHQDFYNEVVGPGFPDPIVIGKHIVAINSMSVGGAPYVDYTFYTDAGSTYISLADPPSEGAIVDIDYNYADLEDGSDDFYSGSVFSLTHIPISGTVECLDFVDPFILADFSDIRFARPLHNTGDYIEIVYTRTEVHGTLWDCDSIVIKERGIGNAHAADITLPITPFRATVDSLFGTLNINGGAAQTSGWGRTRWGYLAYSSPGDCYSVAAPTGLYYRDRTSGMVQGVNWSKLSWPEEGFSQDGAVLEKGNIPRRTAPHFGVSLSGKYAFQGSWGPVSQPGGYTGDDVYRGADTSFPLRMYKRDGKIWGLLKTFEPFVLVADYNGAYPLTILGAGLFHFESYGGWANGRPGCAMHNSSWPTSKTGAVFFTAASWVANDSWLETTRPQNARETYSACPFGVPDAGLTITALGNSGNVRAQYTIKCDTSYTELEVATPSEAVDYAVTHAEDGLSGIPAFGISTIYAATAQWGIDPNRPDLNYRFFYYYMTSTDAAKRPNLLHPGAPFLANREHPVYADYDTLTIENDGTQDICVGPDNDIYLTIGVPYWVRTMDYTVLTPTEQVYGTWDSGVFTTYGPYWAFNMTGYNGVAILSEVVDTNTNPPPNNITYPVLDGNYHQVFPQAGYITPFVQTYNKQVVFINQIIVIDPVHGPTAQLQTFANLAVPWRHEIPHRTYTTFRQKYDKLITEATFYFLPGYDEAPPYDGAITYHTVGDNRENYRRSTRNFLVKLTYDEAARRFAEVYRADISEKHVLEDNGFTIGEDIVPRLEVSVHTQIHSTRTVGPFVVLVRDYPIYSQTSTINPNTGDYYVVTEYDTMVQVYLKENGSLVHSASLEAIVEPVSYSGWKGRGVDIECVVSQLGGQYKALVAGRRVRSGEVFRFEMLFDEMSMSSSYSTDLDPVDHNALQGVALTATSWVSSYFNNDILHKEV